MMLVMAFCQDFYIFGLCSVVRGIGVIFTERQRGLKRSCWLAPGGDGHGIRGEGGSDACEPNDPRAGQPESQPAIFSSLPLTDRTLSPFS